MSMQLMPERWKVTASEHYGSPALHLPQTMKLEVQVHIEDRQASSERTVKYFRQLIATARLEGNEQLLL